MIRYEVSNYDTFENIENVRSNGFDAIITDPPYNLERDQIEYLHNQFMRISKGVVIVFSPPENQWVLPADQYCFWAKPTSTKNTSKSYSRFVEMIFIYGRNSWNSKRHWSQYTNIFTDIVDDTKLHPFRKPPALIERLVLNHTDGYQLVFDPFCGSGVVGDICLKNKREFYGYEIDRDMYLKLEHNNGLI